MLAADPVAAASVLPLVLAPSLVEPAFVPVDPPGSPESPSTTHSGSSTPSGATNSMSAQLKYANMPVSVSCRS